MLFFSTVTVPTVMTATQDHRSYPSRREALPQRPHSWQTNFMQSMFGLPQQQESSSSITARIVTDARPLRRQVEPMYRFSLRRRITDALNSPFHYEMTEAARVVL